MSFDPYYVWLGIPPAEQPPNHYRLLGLASFEENPAVIQGAADRQMAHVRTFQSGPNAAASQRLLSELAAAASCLFDAAKKGSYDQQLRARLAPLAGGASVPRTVYVPVPVPVQVPARVPAAPQPTVSAPQLSGAGAPKSRRQRSTAAELVKVALGGMAGLAVSALLLRFVFQMDVTGLFPVSRSAARPVTIAQSPGATPTKPRQPQPVLPQPAAPPADHSAQKPVSPQTPPDKGPAAPIAVAPTVPTEPPSSAAPSTSPPTLPAPMPPIAAPLAGPIPPPAAEELAAAQKKLEEVFGVWQSKSPAELLNLAAALRKFARELGTKPPERYVALQQAASAALAGGDAVLMLQIVDDWALAFDIDDLTIRELLLVKFADSAREAAQIESLVTAAKPVIQQALAAERYEAAKKITDATATACGRQAGLPFRNFVDDGQRKVNRLYIAWQQYQTALEKLKTSPDDPAANLTAGMWLCRERGNFAAALAYLVKCREAKLVAAAASDLAGPAEAAEQVAVADAWYKLSDGPPPEPLWLIRAAHWYGQPKKADLTALAAAKVEKRLAEIAANEEVKFLQDKLKSVVAVGPKALVSEAARRQCVLLLTFDEADFFETGGQTWIRDRSGRGNNGFVAGPARAAGKVAGALSFDGKDDFVEIADTPSLNPTQGLTICAWVNAAVLRNGSNDCLVSKDDWKGPPRGYVLRFSSGGQLDFTTSNGKWQTAKAARRESTGQWVHGAAVFTGERMSVFVDGVEQASQPSAQTLRPSPYNLRIGRGTFGAERRFTGLIDELAIFAAPLSADEIRAIHAVGQAGQSLAP